MLLISKTFTECTPESAENGEALDAGYAWVNQPCTFRELVDLLKEHSYASSTGDRSVWTWFSTDSYMEDYSTGTERVESIHFSRDNKPSAARYWLKAIKAANL